MEQCSVAGHIYHQTKRHHGVTRPEVRHYRTCRVYCRLPAHDRLLTFLLERMTIPVCRRSGRQYSCFPPPLYICAAYTACSGFLCLSIASGRLSTIRDKLYVENSLSKRSEAKSIAILRPPFPNHSCTIVPECVPRSTPFHITISFLEYSILSTE